MRIIGRALSLTVTVALIALLVAVAVVPRVIGGLSLTVLTGSMRPALSPHDVVITRPVTPDQVCSDVAIGQIVTYLPNPNDPTLITHRVVSKVIGAFDDGTACRLITQGDANHSPDRPVSPAQVRGVFVYGVPKLGWVREWAGRNPILVLVSGTLLIATYLGWEAWRRRGSRPSETERSSYPL